MPIAYAEIDAWRRLTRARPAPSDIATLRELDRAWLEIHATPNPPPEGS